MKNISKTSYLIINSLICSFWILVPAQPAKQHTLGYIKDWQLDTSRGQINASLGAAVAMPDNHSVLFIGSEDAYVPAIAEEAVLLKKVLQEMPATGYQPAKLLIITTWLQHTEFRKQIEERVAASGIWRSCKRRKYCHQAEPLANRLLKSMDAFKEFDGALRAHGLKRKSVRMDDMGVGEKDGHISCSGLIVITLEPEN